MPAQRKNPAAILLTWVVVAALLCLGGWLGNLAAYVAMLGVVLGLVVARDGEAYGTLLKAPWMICLLVAFGLMALAGILNAPTPTARLGIVTFAPILLALPAAALFLQSRLRISITTLATIALAGVAVAALVSTYQRFVLDIGRPNSYQISPIHFGNMAVMLGFVALGGVLDVRNRWRWLFVVGPLFGLVGALMSGTRAAIVLAVIFAPFATYFVIRHAGWRLRWILLALAGTVLAGSAALLAEPSIFGRTLGAFGILADWLTGRQVEDMSFAYRFDMWAGGVQAFWLSPIFGHGWSGHMAAVLPFLSESAAAAYEAERWGYVHNELLAFAVGLGILGAVGYVLLYVSPLLLLWSDRADRLRPARLYFCGIVIIGIGVSGLTDVPMKAELFKTFLAFMPALIVLLCREEEDDGGKEARL